MSMTNPGSRIDDAIYSELELEQLTLDNSILNVFGLCPRKFFYRKVLKLTPKREAPQLSFGSAFHEGLYTYYSDLATTDSEGKEIPLPIAVLRAFAERAAQENSQLVTHIADAKENGVKGEHSIEFGLELMARYMQHYPRESESFKVLKGADGKPMLEVGFALHLGNGTVVGKLDGVIDEGDLLEHKTTSLYLNDDYLSQFTVHNQISIYLAALRELQGKTPKKCVVNVIRAKDYKRGTEEKKEQKLFSRLIVTRTDSQLDQTLRQLEFRINQIKNFLRIGFDAFYQNAPEACTHKFKICEYKSLCMAQEDSLVEMLMDGNFKREEWQPYDIEGAKKIVDVTPKLD